MNTLKVIMLLKRSDNSFLRKLRSVDLKKADSVLLQLQNTVK